MIFQCYISLPEGIYPYHINIFSKRSPNTLHTSPNSWNLGNDGEHISERPSWKHVLHLFSAKFLGILWAYNSFFQMCHGPNLEKKSPTGDDSYRSMGTFLGWFIMVPNHPSQPILVCFHHGDLRYQRF